MKKTLKLIFSSFLILALTPSSLQAKLIAPDAARQNATLHLDKSKSYKLKGKATVSGQTALKLAETVSDAKSRPMFYIFSRGTDNGFIIASADDRLVPVLGYTDKGSFTSVENLPEALRSWLKDYEYAIEKYYNSSSEDSPIVFSNPKEREDIPELLELFWGQDQPFNKKSPVVFGERAPVGCVGLAMAMAVNHHRFPEQGTGSVSYTNNADKQSLSYDFSTKHFEYDKILQYYIGDEDDEFIDAVAELCLACGMSVKSEYTVSGTGANLSASVFSRYFNYPSAGLALLGREYFTPEEWDDLVYEDLKNDCPVVYRGGSIVGTNGHAFVIDGYENGLFHINWGWYGDSNGYFNLSILRPGSSGTGSNSDDIYSASQQLVRGLRSPDKKVPTPIFTAESVAFNLESGEYSFVKLNCRGNQEIILPGLKAINTETGEVTDIPSSDTTPIDLSSSTAQTVTFKPAFNGISDGKYILRPAVKLPDDENVNPGHYTDYYIIYPTLVNTRFVNVEILDGKVVSTTDGTDADHDIEFTNFRSSTALITGSNLAFTMDGENRGNTMIQAVKVWVYEHNTDKPVVTGSRCSLILEPGSSGTFDLALPSITNRGGIFDLQIKNNEDSTINYSERIPFTLANGSVYEIIDGVKYVVISEDEKTASAIRYSTSLSGELVLPEQVVIKGETYTLTELSNSFMNGASKITKVTLPATLRRIAGSAFSGCSALTEINLPSELEYLGGSCFNGCKSLTSITIPKNITEIRVKTFTSSGLTSVDLPEGLVSIGDYAFYSCKLEKPILPSTVKSIGNYAFDNANINTLICRATTPPEIKEFTFYSETYRNTPLFVPVESIEVYKKAPNWEKFKKYYQINTERYVKVDDLWYELTDNFEAYVIAAPEGNSYTFQKVTVPGKINYVGMDYTVTEISDYAFYGLSDLTACTGGANLRKIGAHAFDGTPLSSTPLTNSVHEIGDYAFHNTNIGTIARLPENLNHIGKYAFAGNKRMNFYKGFNENNWLELPVTLESIGDGAFEGCEALNTLQLSTFIEFGQNVFDGCTALRDFYLADTSIPLDLARYLAESLGNTYFYIDKENRNYFKDAFDHKERLYDLLSVKSVNWAGYPNVSGITKATITFDSPLGNTAVSSILMKDNLFKDIGSVNIDSTDRYATDSIITIAIAPTVKTTGHIQINFVQSGLSTAFDVNITEIANLIQEISLSETSKNLRPKESFNIAASYSPQQVDNSELVWSSSNSKVATVDGNGNVTAIGIGTATITCKALMGLASAKCSVIVAAEVRPGKAIDEDDPNAEITVADINAIASYIMGVTVDNFNLTNADANQDGNITISDVTTTVKIMLNVYDSQTETARTMLNMPMSSEQSVAVLSFDDVNIQQNGIANVSVRLSADESYSSVQTDIICPAGLEINDIKLTNAMPAHSLAWAKIEDKRYRLIIYSVTNANLPSTDDEIAEIKFFKNGPVAGALGTENGWIATPSANKTSVSSTGGNIFDTSGFIELADDRDDAIVNVYNVSGVLILQNIKFSDLTNHLSSGFYIVVGADKSYKMHIK